MKKSKREVNIVLNRAKEFEVQRKALDASEREEAALMVEVRIMKRNHRIGRETIERNGWWCIIKSNNREWCINMIRVWWIEKWSWKANTTFF